MKGAGMFAALLIYTTLQCLQVPLQYTAWSSSKPSAKMGEAIGNESRFLKSAQGV